METISLDELCARWSGKGAKISFPGVIPMFLLREEEMTSEHCEKQDCDAE